MYKNPNMIICIGTNFEFNLENPLGAVLLGVVVDGYCIF